jgi:hypothetical protein
MIELSRATPHAWALDAYRQLLTRDDQSAALAPNLAIVVRSCLVLTGFGAGFLGLAVVSQLKRRMGIPKFNTAKYLSKELRKYSDNASLRTWVCSCAPVLLPF